MTDKVVKILSINGGGVRGIFAAKILSLMETELHMNIHEYFDLIVGTSTGSIIAAAIAINYDLTQLVNDYSESAEKIFTKRFSLCGLLKSKYSSRHLANFLYGKLGDITLGEIEKPLILNAANVSVGDVHIFKSSYQHKLREGDYVRDGNVPLHRAVLASCSAPIYFDPVDINGTLVCDGGIWANNPSLVGYTDALRNFKTNNVKILSLGTGQGNKIYQPKKKWGFLTGWKHTKLIDFVMLCQTKFPDNVLQLIELNNIFRINPIIDGYELDNHKNISIFIELAKSEFAQTNTRILNFLNLENKR